MKAFVSKVSVFILLLPIFFYAKPLYLLYHDKYKQLVTSRDVYLSLTKSKQKRKVKKILLGDSVANQLFPNTTNNDTINSLACNQAIGLVGHYILLANYMKAGNKADTVFLLFNPLSFKNNLDQVFTYHYFLKPFYTKANAHLFTETVTRQIEKIPYYRICREPYILTSNWAPDFESKDSVTYTLLSPISAQYIHKMKQLSRQYKFKLLIVPTPVSTAKKVLVQQISRNELIENNLDAEFNDYFKNIIYLDDSLFIDGIHLKKPAYYTALYRDRYLNIY